MWPIKDFVTRMKTGDHTRTRWSAIADKALPPTPKFLRCAFVMTHGQKGGSHVRG